MSADLAKGAAAAADTGAEAEAELTDATTASCAEDGTDSDCTIGDETARPESQTRGFSPQETILIFDWDDTVLPSSWVQEQGLRLDDGSVVSDEQRAILDELAAAACQLIQSSKSFGTIVLVTNAERGWIELSCRKFLPTLYPVLEGVRAMSARTTYESQGISSPFEWKFLAFSAEIRNVLDASPATQRWNVISLGDSTHEREALIRVTQELPNCRTKSLKFMERPAVDQLKREHELVTNCFSEIVHHDGNLDLCIRCT